MPDLQAMIARLKSSLQMQGEHFEGTDGDQGDLFNPGDTYATRTWPEEVQIIDGGEGAGVIRYPFKSMVRHKHYIAMIETISEDYHYNGVVTAKYEFTFSGRVLVHDINFEGDHPRRSGQSIVQRLQNMNAAAMGE